MAYFVEDHGQRFPQGMPVRIDRSSGKPEVIPDPNGDQEIHSCQPQTGMAGGPRLLSIKTRPRREIFDMPALYDPHEELEVNSRVIVRQVDGASPCLALDPRWEYTILARQQHPDHRDWLRFTILPRA